MKNLLSKFLFVYVLFFFSLAQAEDVVPVRHVNVFLAGTGVVGSELLGQIEANHDQIFQKYGLDVRVVGLATSRAMCVQPTGLSLKYWRLALDQANEKMSWPQFLHKMLQSNCACPVFVDCTSNQEIADSYELILNSGISIATASKKANSGSSAYYKGLREAAKKSGALFCYDANVGAGLPILSTIRSLARSGDQVQKVEAVFSGTLSYLFNSFQEGMLFSDLVKEAQKKGFTEPDPRDDLNGMDVARKILIVAREAGYSLELADVQLQQFLPEECFRAKTVAGFYEELQKYDDAMTKRQNEAQQDGKRLRYIASFADGRAQISLQAVGPDHPFYHLAGCDNICAITSKCYSMSPLVIQGPGAGREVTASRVLEGIVQRGLLNLQSGF